MKERILIITFLTVVGVTATAIIISLPAVNTIFDFAKNADLGTAVSGLTSPTIGLTSIVLLYLALTKQTESNVEQQLKNESDMIFSLINQMDNELDKFYTTAIENHGELKTNITTTGLQGLMNFARKYKFELPKKFIQENDLRFKNFYEFHQVLLLIKSFELIEERIKTASITNNMKELFFKKSETYYICKFRLPFKYILEGVQKFDQEQTAYAKMITKFVSTKKSYHENFE